MEDRLTKEDLKDIYILLLNANLDEETERFYPRKKVRALIDKLLKVIK